ncbi:hypothetical protein GWI33_006429 [Rhynchophorus ferrugineus]|uniref:Uncharacterized protein n=1 Tax=Rhynchophorus ferrugineus TaxID=354439 RepID=A0A834MDS9_RHYFE|nr:hypothetical protein GWI33_006429 [Rhynchophorus ferrugineus]
MPSQVTGPISLIINPSIDFNAKIDGNEDNPTRIFTILSILLHRIVCSDSNENPLPPAIGKNNLFSERFSLENRLEWVSSWCGTERRRTGGTRRDERRPTNTETTAGPGAINGILPLDICAGLGPSRRGHVPVRERFMY